jgi:hypothetical protein
VALCVRNCCVANAEGAEQSCETAVPVITQFVTIVCVATTSFKIAAPASAWAYAAILDGTPEMETPPDEM